MIYLQKQQFSTVSYKTKQNKTGGESELYTLMSPLPLTHTYICLQKLGFTLSVL